MSYTPDYIAETSGGALVVECLSSKHAESRRMKEALSGLRLYWWRYAMYFTHVTDRQLRAGCYLSNVKLLTRYARLEVDPSITQEILDILRGASNFLTVGQLAIQLCPEYP